MKRSINVVFFLLVLTFPLISFAADYSYYFPYFKETNNRGTGVALRNCSATSTAHITVNVYTGGGTKLNFDPAAEIPSNLPPRNQKAFLIDTNLVNSSGWIQVDSSQPLVGLSFVSIDNLMMDLTIFSELYTSLYIPHSAQNNSWDTTLYICNPNGTSTTVTITIVDAGGDVIDQLSDVLATMGSKIYPLGDLLSDDYSNGSVEISATQGIAAFALYDNLKTTNGKSFAGISALQPETSSVNPPRHNYDGSWSGNAYSTTEYGSYGDPCPDATLNFTVSGSQISGTAGDSFGNTYSLQGTVDDQGNVQLAFFQGFETAGSITGTCSGTGASGTWEETYGCHGTWNATKN